MPDIDGMDVFFGLTVAGVVWLVLNRRGRRLPVWGVVAVGGVAALVAAPVLSVMGRVMGAVPFLSEVTGGMVFIGLWVALVVLTVFEPKGGPRRVPIWLGIVVAVAAMIVVPPLLNTVTGAYQDASLRGDVNNCTRGMGGAAGVFEVKNTCDDPIVVGLCLADEKNPVPCQQSKTIAPGGVAVFDSKGQGRSALPSNLNGFTIVACREQHRPSRTLKVGGRGYRGVCLPGA